MIKQHFSALGDVCTVELVSEDGVRISNASNNCSANVTFLTRHSAERAFVDGRSWQGQDLKFIWLSSDKDPHRTSSDTSRDADMEPENEAEIISLNETPCHKESQSPTQDDSDEPLETGKVSAVIERET